MMSYRFQDLPDYEPLQSILPQKLVNEKWFGCVSNHQTHAAFPPHPATPIGFFL